MSGPLLSVITVCRNAQATIEATMDSVAAEKSSAIEYVVVDGASTDATLSLVRARGGLVDKLISEPDTGIFNAMNKGAAVATGSYVCYLNADDAYLPGALSALLAQVQAYPNVGMFYGDWVGVDSNGKRIERRSSAELGWHYRLCHQAMTVRRDVLGSQPFDERYSVCADFDAILKWLDSTSSARVPFPMVRFSEAGVSNTNVNRAVKEGIVIAARRRGLVKTWRFCLTTSLYWIKFTMKSLVMSKR
jgi:glycosyltransferase involved in cell wall biosynthesis